ncbi:MAG: helix-turn-helix domain-containing protein [Bacilli bacterium]|nr:helix-turn-helix domain-containing protein [Bacilli bacterium]
MENLASIVGKNLASLRKAKGLTQQDLAKEINYSDKSISKWELGYSLPSVDILKDFAAFYGVTIDYLVAEQSQEDLEKIAKAEEEDEKIRFRNQIIVIALTVTFVFLVAICVFFSGYYNPFKTRPAGEPAHKGLWVIFVWMIPVSIFLAAVECWHYYHNRKLMVILLSSFAWTLLLSFCVQFQFYNDEPEIIWYILVVGIPIQIILILWGNFRPKKKTATKK